MTFVLLALAIIIEVTATLLLKASNGFEKWWFGMVAFGLYSFAGLVFSFVLKSMNVGIAYAIWSGAGIALVCVASVFIWQQKLDHYAIAGIILIVIGSILITTKSSSMLS